MLNRIYFGFKVIDVNANIVNYSCKNNSSCVLDKNYAKLSGPLKSEVNEHKLSVVNNKPIYIHSLGVIGKKGTHKIRPITDCSQPELMSINCFMDQVQDKFHYETVENIVNHMIEGECFVMSTVDLAYAYQSVMIRPSDREFFGLLFEGHYYVDNCSCFGSRCSPFIFNRLTPVEFIWKEQSG